MSLLTRILKCVLAAVETPAQAPNAAPDASDNRERAIAHAKDGYKNAQDIIRFIDTKSTYFAGASVVLLGFTLQLIKQYFELPANFQEQLKNAADSHPFCILVIDALAALSLLAGALCIWSCVLSLVGRPPRQNMEHISTILFPFFTGTAGEWEVCRKVSAGMTDLDVAKEYECQLWNVGMILQAKIRRNRWAAWMILGQIIALTIGGILLLFCVQF